MLRVRVAAAVALAVVVVGAGLYLVVTANASAGAASTRAGALLQTVDADTPQIDGALQKPSTPELSWTAKNPDFKAAKQRLDAFVTRIDGARSTIAADAGRLRSAQAELRSQGAGLLALPSRSALDREQSRVAAMRSALGSADAALAIERDQVRTMSAVIDAFDDVGTLSVRLGSGDLVGGIAMLSGASAKLQSAAQLAKSEGNPVEVGLLISGMQTYLGDVQSLLQAAERGDTSAERSSSSKLDADSSKLVNVQLDQIGSLELALLQPDISRYHGSLEAAGFRSATGGGPST